MRSNEGSKPALGSSLAHTAHKVSRVSAQLKEMQVNVSDGLARHHERSAGVRCAARAFKFLSHALTQFAIYVAYIYMFQLL